VNFKDIEKVLNTIRFPAFLNLDSFLIDSDKERCYIDFSISFPVFDSDDFSDRELKLFDLLLLEGYSFLDELQVTMDTSQQNVQRISERLNQKLLPHHYTVERKEGCYILKQFQATEEE